jgi:hypothetical protein
LEAIRVLNAASARLLGEFRMHALALPAYRAARQKSVPTPQDGRLRLGLWDRMQRQ